MMMRYWFIVVVFHFSLLIVAQKIAPINRDIVLTYDDSTVITQVLIKNLDTKTSYPLMYNWYFKETIGKSQNGYFGNLLHGNYLAYDLRKRLMRSGSFSYGLKNGVWKSWYPSGLLKSSEEWKKGLLNGAYTNYTPEGKVSLSATYKEGLLTGKYYLYQGDSCIVRKYVAGKEKIHKPTIFSRWFSRWF